MKKENNTLIQPSNHISLFYERLRREKKTGCPNRQTTTKSQNACRRRNTGTSAVLRTVGGHRLGRKKKNATRRTIGKVLRLKTRWEKKNEFFK